MRTTQGDEMRLLVTMCWIIACSTARAGEIRDLYEASGSSPKDVQRVDLLRHTDHGITEIGIERTGCMGWCPVYVLIVKRDGTFRYIGDAEVARLGTHTGKIADGEFNRLAEFIRDSGYMNLKDGYVENVTDISTTYTTVVMNGQRKVVMHYGDDDGPSSLWVTEVLIDRLLEGATWN